MTKTLEAQDKLIREIFEGSYQFEIPDYQRPYAWTTEQASELFDDLVFAMRDAARFTTPRPSSQYFLGSIVLIKNGRDPKSSVVDGQQRLSTLTILFAALRAAMPDAADDITDFLYKKGKASLGEKNEYRLIAREEDAEFFRTNIQELGGIDRLIKNVEKLRDSRLRYRENATLMYQKAMELTEDDRSALWNFLANDCSLVVISTPDLEAAYRIFSVLNNRGLDLAPIDIIKAEVLGQINVKDGAEKGREYAKKWSRIENDLGRDAFGELFGHIRSIYAKQKQKHTLIKEFREHVVEYKKPIVLMDKVIEPYAQVWEFVRDASFESNEGAKKVNEYLSWLNRVDFKDWVPPVLVYFKRFRQNPRGLVGFLKLLEGLTYFLWVTKARSQERIKSYSELTKEIELESFEGDPLSLPSLKLSESQKRKFVSMLDGNIYEDLSKARMALIMRLETLVRDKGVRLDEDAVSLEHVLPQMPPSDSKWIDWFPRQVDRELWVHRLANLVPLDRNKNSAASNYDFEKKKDAYFKGRGKGKASPFVLTQEVRSENEWTFEILAARQKRLVGRFVEHWDLKVAESDEVD